MYTKAPPVRGVRILGHRLRQRDHERLRVPRHHTVRPQAFGDRLFRAALQRHQGLAALVGWSFESISFANRAAAEVNIFTGGIRATFGAAAFDFGVFDLYPGGKQAAQYGAATDAAGRALGNECLVNFLPNGNVIKKDVSFFEVYGKVNYTFNDTFSLGANAYYSPNFLTRVPKAPTASITGKVIAHVLRNQRHRRLCVG